MPTEPKKGPSTLIKHGGRYYLRLAPDDIRKPGDVYVPVGRADDAMPVNVRTLGDKQGTYITETMRPVPIPAGYRMVELNETLCRTDRFAFFKGAEITMGGWSDCTSSHLEGTVLGSYLRNFRYYGMTDLVFIRRVAASEDKPAAETELNRLRFENAALRKQLALVGAGLSALGKQLMQEGNRDA